ncbi:hypothetical protein [Jongsikchunia kroppenstedtii]|uniref:hypothetical protein n=1 Tax=Jongsikchunia kroppenstedtii TaxID=1121721 RepID=UPI00035E6806|nr:hypothetical protein [Jongsikchunia kroppenstedtii]
MDLTTATKITLLAAGLIFLLALILGIWKYREMSVNDDHLAHPYVDIAHRAALLYSFATLLIAVFVQLSGWADWVNLTAAMVLVFFFVAAIASYIAHGLRRDTTNQFEHADAALHASMAALIIGEVGGFAVLLAGFIDGQFG